MSRRRISTRSGRPLETLGTQVLERFKALAPRALDEAAMEWERKTKLLLSQQGHGRTYRFEFRSIQIRGRWVSVPFKSLSRLPHTASRPGEPPARDKGQLVRSIHWRRVSLFTRRLASGSKVGLWLDKGTRRIKPRPWLLPSLSAAGPAMTVAMRRVMNGKG